MSMPEIVLPDTEVTPPVVKAKHSTFDMLKKKKKPATDTFDVVMGDGETVTFVLVATTTKIYDSLLTECPPTNEQRINGSSFNGDVFGPALMAVVCVEPKAPKEEWASLLTDENWSRGEVSNLFFRAMELCNHQLDVTPTSAG